jgi:polyisoprenoid-binding protein YceI
MRKLGFIIALGLIVSMSSFRPDGSKVITKTGHIKIFSHTAAEDINANYYKVISTLDPASGVMVFSVPMQGFEFEKALMQKHFNSPKFLDTKQFPKAKFKGVISNMKGIDLAKDGVHSVTVKGDLTLHGITKTIEEKGTITVKGGAIVATSKFNIVLADYKIAFEKGKPSTNIAKEIELNIKMDYKAN